jgi:hypothetical protein
MFFYRCIVLVYICIVFNTVAAQTEDIASLKLKNIELERNLKNSITLSWVYVSAHSFIILLKIFLFCKYKRNFKARSVPTSMAVVGKLSESNGIYAEVSLGKELDPDYVTMKNVENTYDVLNFNTK